MYEKSIYNEYFETVVTNGFIPKKLLPIKLTRNHGNLIDNFFAKSQMTFLTQPQASSCIKSQIISHIFLCLGYFVCLDHLNLSKTHSYFIKIIKHDNIAEN